MSADEDILKELRKISRLITISNGPAIEKELSKYATSDERKKIWALIDGKSESEQIAREIKITKRSVDRALQQFEVAGLIEERKYGTPPKRILDYVPSVWIELQQRNSQITTSQPAAREDEQSKEEADTNV